MPPLFSMMGFRGVARSSRRRKLSIKRTKACSSPSQLRKLSYRATRLDCLRRLTRGEP
jgi:hypothetical protein